MRYSKYFIHTLFEVPKEAETASHILLLRAGYISPVAAGVYSLLPLGHRANEKVKSIIREEMDGIGGLELTMPVLNPAELWKKTRRYYDIGQELIRFFDRKQREFVLAMTHEEVVTDIARQFLRSYRDLPVMLYQIQTKIRDEARPRAGLLRVREFNMKDAYSFHPNFADLDGYYPRIFNAYLRVFARCGLHAVPIEADSGIMGGAGSHEFMLQSVNGEDHFVMCSRCAYRANTEKAVGLKPPLTGLTEPAPAMETVDTPKVKTIADLMRFFGASEAHFLKTVAYEADGELVLAVTRGDFAISPTKLTNHLQVIHLDLAGEALLAANGLHAGFLSPIGIRNVRVVLDDCIDEQALYIAGANEPDRHCRNVLYGRDFTVAERVDISEVRAGDPCLQCQEGVLEISRGIELGHTFKLGTKYTDANSMDATYLDADGRHQRVVMGCYGIGVERLLASTAEQWHDAAGLMWPPAIAPFQVILTGVGQKGEVLATAETLYAALQSRYEVLYDDRDLSPGVKFKDADLLGIPLRVVISPKLHQKNQVEIKVRTTGEVLFCATGDLLQTVDQLMASLQPSLEGLPYLPEERIERQGILGAVQE
jgi:prolyl-tRNA synthetase